MPTLLIILVIETWSKQKYLFSFFSKFLTKGRFSLSHFCENLVSIITILSVKDKDLFLSRVIWRPLICHKRFSFIQSSRLLVSFSIPTSENILRLPISAPFLLSLILSVKHISRDWISSSKIFNRLKSLKKTYFRCLRNIQNYTTSDKLLDLFEVWAKQLQDDGSCSFINHSKPHNLWKYQQHSFLA